MTKNENSKRPNLCILGANTKTTRPDSYNWPVDFSEIREIESCAADSLPTRELEIYDGWRLRFNDGVGRRANSVLAEKSGAIGLEQKLAYAENYYAGHELATRFQINIASQPTELAELLIKKAYEKAPGAKVKTADINTLGSKTALQKVDIFSRANDIWLNIYEQVESADYHKTTVRRAMFDKMPLSSAFALAYIDDSPAAVGLGVLIRGRLGIFNMATLPELRKRGAAKSIVYSLAKWAKERKAEQIYLQVTHANAGAQKAYKKMGFVKAYEYDYYTKSLEVKS